MRAHPHPLLPANFIRRANRFRATVRLADGSEVAAHVPNSGRLGELLTPDAPCYVTPNPQGGKTSHTLRLVRHGDALVSVDARLPNPLFADAWRRGALGPRFAGYTDLRSEVTRGESRLDFLLTGPSGRLWVEVKSVTLVGGPETGLEDGIARFPDAPTMRGAKHLGMLMDAAAAGDGAAVVFVIQRDDAMRFTPHEAADPLFAAALRAAAATGVSVHAYGCRVTLAGIAISQPVPVMN